jgi:hypothetical protein
MAKLLPIIPPGDGFNMYLRLRYLLAGIARCLFFYDKELVEIMQSAPCRNFSARCTEHYFHESRSAAIYDDMTLLFQSLITIAPILQQQQNSMGFDWHHGHVLTWFRVNTAAHVGRHFLSVEEHPRVHDSLVLRENLNILNIHDSRFVDTLEMLFRAYYGRPSLTGKLANTLFDPIMLSHLGDRETLRVGNRLFRMEKRAFHGCIDLCEDSAVVLAYRIKRIETQEKVTSGGKRSSAKPKTVTHRMLEITIDERHIGEFRQFVKTVTNSGLSLKYKIAVLDRRVGAFVHSVRYARNGFEQVLSLSRWLRYRLAPLCTEAERKARIKPDYLYDLVHRLPDIMVNKFMMSSDYRRYYRRPSFFYDPREHDELTLINFLSPYREGE